MGSRSEEQEVPSLSIPSHNARRLLLLAGLALLFSGASATEARSQGLEGLVAPGGSVLFEVFPSFHTFDEGFDPGGESVPLAAPFASDALGSEFVPQLRASEQALGGLLDEPELRLRLGVSRAVIHGHEARFPIRAAWGITDRITVGALVPIVRRRVEAGFSFSPAGANVGPNLYHQAPAQLEAFLASVEGALEGARQRAAEICALEGPASPECIQAQELVASGEVLLGGLSPALAGAPVAPLAESPAGILLLERVQALREGIVELGAPAFEGTVALPSEPLGEGEFRSRFLEPVYGPNRPPAGSWPGIPELGDVELQAAVLLVDRAIGSAGESAEPVRLRSAAAAALRLGTQQPDTLRDHFEGELPQGHSGARLRLANELDFRGTFGLGLHLEFERFEPADVRRRIGGPESVLDPEVPRTAVRWTPGTTMAVEAAPRLYLTGELSVGARYRYFARGRGRYEEIEPVGRDLSVLLPAADVRSHRLGGEIAYSTLEAHRAGRTPVPFVVRFRLERAISGSGERVPVGTRLEGGFRVFVNL